VSVSKGTATMLRRSAGVALLAAVLVMCVPGQAGAVKGAKEFYARVAGGKTVTCAVYDGYLDQHVALCEYTASHSQAKATLNGDGSVVLCRSHSISSNRCELGDAGVGSPTYAPGKTVKVGRFACSVQKAGVRCTIAASGEGFLFGPKRLRAVGGAPVHHH
jgi:hypothetical protein